MQVSRHNCRKGDTTTVQIDEGDSRTLKKIINTVSNQGE